MTDPHLPLPRISDAERRRASERLQAACVEGYLSLDEFSQRVERALAARTRAELSAVLGDLPPPSSLPVSVAAPTSRTGVILSAVERSGTWRLAPTSSVLVAFGSCKLDLRRASITSRQTTIAVRVLFGRLEMIVPSGVELDVEAWTVLSQKALRLGGPPPGSDVPRIVVRGSVLGGSLVVRDQVRPIFGLA